VAAALKVHELPVADTAGAEVPLELGSAVEDGELDEVDELVLLDPQPDTKIAQVAIEAVAKALSFIERRV
jgi:hypothetical protein